MCDQGVGMNFRGACDGNDDYENSDEDNEDSCSSRSSCIIHVSLECWMDYQLGFVMEGGSNTPLKYICIQSLVPGTPAFECGYFREGDQLVMIGDVCLIGATLEEAEYIVSTVQSAAVEVVAQRKSTDVLDFSFTPAVSVQGTSPSSYPGHAASRVIDMPSQRTCSI